MTRFKKRVLSALEGVYGFIGGQRSSSELDLASPVQPVHDVSRLSERASGFYANLFEANVIAAASTAGNVDMTMAEIMAQAGIAARLAELGLLPIAVDVWLIDMWQSVDLASAAEYDLGAVGFQTATFPGGAALVALRRYSGGSTARLTTAGPLFLLPQIQTADPVVNMLPAFLGNGGQVATGLLWRAVTNAGGGMTWNAHALIWIGPKGTAPPGHA